MKYFYIVFLTLTIFLNFISSKLSFNYNIFQDTTILINLESIFLSMKMISAAIAFYVTNRIITLDKLHREIIFTLCQKNNHDTEIILRVTLTNNITKKRYYEEIIFPIYSESIKNLSDKKMIKEFHKLREESIRIMSKNSSKHFKLNVNFNNFRKRKIDFIWENI